CVSVCVLLFRTVSLRFLSFALRFSPLFFISPATPACSPLSLHDALPISWRGAAPQVFHPAPGAAQLRLRQLGHPDPVQPHRDPGDRKSTRLNSSHVSISYAVFCLKKKSNSVIRSFIIRFITVLSWSDCLL